MSRRLTTKEFIDRARKVHGDKYDYSLVQYKRWGDKIRIICPIHGIFEQNGGSHLCGFGCRQCTNNELSNKKKKTTDQFIIDAYCKHDDMYNYKLVDYKNNRTKVKIICYKHGIFEQKPKHHIRGSGCPKCAGNIKNDTKQFIEKAIEVHGDKYDYSLVDYKNCSTKVKIICPIHGIFEQDASNHIHLKRGCSKCAGQYKEKYAKNNIPVYNTYAKQLEFYGIKCRRNKEDTNILEVKCMYCDKWYIPTLISVWGKINSIKNINQGECNLYCSDECKHACPTYGQKLYPKGFKINTSREVQPQLRKLVLKRDNYTCQKCFATNVELHCHHYEGIEVNPIESADMDNCITLCKACHNTIHKLDKCGIKDYKREKC